MDKNLIEGNAVDYVKIALRNTGIIDPCIQERDKTPSWDGELITYKSEEFNKKNIKAIIPVQVKGRSFDKFRNTFQVEVVDLINYKIKQNVIFFLVQFVKGEYKIYFKALQLFDLEKIIKEAGNREKVSLSFEPFPERNSSKAKELILEFIKNAEKQTQLIPGVLSVSELYEKIKKVTLTFNLNMKSNFNAADIYSSIMSQKPYIYYKDEKGVVFPVDKLENFTNLAIGQHNNAEICVDGTKYYDGYDVVSYSEGTKIQIGKYIWIILEQENLTLNYKYDGTIKERLKTLNFVLSIHKGEKLFLGNCELSIKTMKLDDDDFIKNQNLVDFYNDVQKLFDKLGIVKELDLDSLTQQQINNLYEFCQSELYDKEVSLGLKKSGQGVLRLNNINIYCYCFRNKKKNKVHSIFNDKAIRFCVEVDNEKIPVSPYLMLAEQSTDTFDKVDNINYSELISSIKEYGISDKTEGAHINLLLKMLLYFDKTKRVEILETSNSLAETLYLRNNSAINLINLCQCVKRKEVLSRELIDKLISIKNGSTKLDIKAACSILLASKLEAQKYLEEMEIEEKETFVKYPLMNLYNINS